MQSIVALFWRIATFRAGPETIPFSAFLAPVLVVLNLVAAVLLYLVLSEASLLRALSLTLVSLAVTAGLAWVLLLSMGHKERFLQTFSAMVGSDLLIGIIQTLAYSITQKISQELSLLILLTTTFWTLAVWGFIFHRALNMQIGLGIAIAFIFFLVSVSITSTALPQA
jgi:hypothetical protein